MNWEVEYTDEFGDWWYEVHVPLADRLYEDHLRQLREEGLSDD